MALCSSENGDWDVLLSVEPNILKKTKMISITKGFGYGDCAVLVTHSGELYAVGSSALGLLGLGDVTQTAKPLQLNVLSGVIGACICGTWGDAVAFTKKGQLYVWGKNNSDGSACGTPTLKRKLTDIVDARCIEGHYLALTSEGKVYEWRGATFSGSSTVRKTPTVKPFDKKIVGIVCGISLSLAVTEGGQVCVWGKTGNSHELPLSTVSVEGETFIKVVCGHSDFAGLTASHKIFTWNARFGGILSTPVQVGRTLGGRFVYTASNFDEKYAAITDTGAVYTWNSGKETSLTRTNFIKLHQVFAAEEFVTFSWEQKSNDSLDTYGFASLEDIAKQCFNKKETSDLTVMVDNKAIYLHKFVLNLRSKFFRTLLQNQGTDKDQREIVLTSFNYEVFVSYFWYLYSSEIKSVAENLLELWTLADVYNEDKLKLSCEQIMEKTMTFKQVAKQYSKKCNELIKKEQEKVASLEILNTQGQDESREAIKLNREQDGSKQLQNCNAERVTLEELRNVIEELQNLIDEEHRKFRNLKDSNKEQVKELKEKLVNLRLENVNEKQHEYQQEKFENAENVNEKQLKDLQEKFERLENDYVKQQEEFERLKNANGKQHKDLQEKFERLENVHSVQQEEFQMLRNLNAEQQKKPTRLEDMNVFREHKKKPKRSKAVNAKHEEELQRLETHISELKEELESVRVVNAKQHNIIEKLQKVNNEHQEMIERLQNLNSKQQRELEKLEKVSEDQQQKFVLQLQTYLLQQQNITGKPLSDK